MNLATPDYSNLFRMRDPLASRAMRLETYDDEWLGWRQATSLFRRTLKLESPLKLRRTMGGRQPSDVMWSTFSPIKVISQRVVDILNVGGFTGWSTYCVEVQDGKGAVLPGYHGLAVTGRAGERDLRRVTALLKRPWEGGNVSEVLKGLFFEDDSWDGSDFCLIGTTIGIVVTQRVVQAFKAARIRNVLFTPLPDEETPASNYEVQGLWPLKDGQG